MLKQFLTKLQPLSIKFPCRFSHINSLDNQSIPRVPKDSIKKSFSCSGGPGGQHVNKVATKAEIRFSLDDDWIPNEFAEIMTKKYGYRLNKDKEIVISSTKTRSQVHNLDDCFEKLNQMLYACAQQIHLNKRKTPNGADAEVLVERKEKADHFRRLEKERHSLKKRFRSQIYD
uniref:Prokaryotic-type class I peptide chain release factors domain-containing protein n=1 Tax=Panagrolaimus sp. JU765 TaxID=591449 RepID=A0AC34RE72_9BILA